MSYTWSEQVALQLSQFSAVEIEEKLLGLIMTEPKMFDTVNKLLTPSDFTATNRSIFEAMQRIAEYGLPGLQFVINELRVTMKLDAVGGAARVQQIALDGLHIPYAEQACIVIGEHADKRRASRLMVNAFDDMKQGEKSALEVAEQLRRDFEGIGQSRKPAVPTFADRLVASFELLSNRTDKKTESCLMQLGYPSVDTILGGFDKGDLVILAARPSIGKTMFSLNIAYNLLANQKRVAYISKEMSCDRVTTRLISRHTQVNSKNILSGMMSRDELILYSQAIGYFSDLPFYLFDSTDKIATFDQIARHLRPLKGQIDIVMIDHLLKLCTGNEKLDANPVLKYTFLSDAFKTLAQELEIPILLLSQLNRDVKSRQTKQPELTDLKESGAIEQDADIVLFLHRDYYFDRKSENKDIAEVIIAKNRDGEVGSAYLKYIPQIQLFTELEPGEHYKPSAVEKGRYAYRKKGYSDYE